MLLFHQHRARHDRGDEAVLPRQHELRGDVEAPDRIGRDLVFLRPDLHAPHDFRSNHTARQHGALVILGRQERFQIQPGRPWRAVVRDVQRVLRVGIAVVVERRPFGAPVFDAEGFLDGRAEPAGALDLPAPRQAVGPELDVLAQLRPAPVVVDAVIVVDGAAVLGHGQRADRSRRSHERVLRGLLRRGLAKDNQEQREEEGELTHRAASSFPGYDAACVHDADYASRACHRARAFAA